MGTSEKYFAYFSYLAVKFAYSRKIFSSIKFLICMRYVTLPHCNFSICMFQHHPVKAGKNYKSSFSRNSTSPTNSFLAKEFYVCSEIMFSESCRNFNCLLESQFSLTNKITDKRRFVRDDFLFVSSIRN